MVTLFTTHCPQCNVLEKVLKQNNIEFNTVDNQEEILKVAQENQIYTSPILQVDDKYMEFKEALAWARGE